MKLDTLHSLQRYAKAGVPTGSFLHAVLTNDLKEAVKRGDDENLRDLVEIARYVIWMMPAACHGSPDKVAAWLKTLEREVAP